MADRAASIAPQAPSRALLTVAVRYLLPAARCQLVGLVGVQIHREAE